MRTVLTKLKVTSSSNTLHLSTSLCAVGFQIVLPFFYERIAIKVEESVSSENSSSHAEVLMDNMNKTGQSSSCSESIFPSTEESGPSQIFKKLKPPADVSISDTNGWKGGGLKSYLLCHRVRVYNQFPDISFPNHVTVLPVSDDKWVPFILEFPNEASN